MYTITHVYVYITHTYVYSTQIPSPYSTSMFELLESKHFIKKDLYKKT